MYLELLHLLGELTPLLCNAGFYPNDIHFLITTVTSTLSFS